MGFCTLQVLKVRQPVFLPSINRTLFWYLSRRHPVLDRAFAHPNEHQSLEFQWLLARGSQSVYGALNGFDKIQTEEAWRNEVPLVEYDQLLPYIEDAMAGAPDRLWPGSVACFAKSSGTTSTRSKFIPITRDSLVRNHYAAGHDLLAMYQRWAPNTRLFEGKSLRLAGHVLPHPEFPARTGDLSAILTQNLPFWAKWRSSPNMAVALLEDWDDKMERTVDQVLHENITSLFGVPSWLLVLLRRVREKAGVEDLHQLWPNLELFAHGAINLAPYRDSFESLFPGNRLHYLESYNATEGYFAVQDRSGVPGMALLTNRGVYFEFIPMSAYRGTNSDAVGLGDVEVGETYAVVISTAGGLWRYLPGDTVRFVSTAPYRIEFAGRTRLYINAFGEEVILDNAEKAMALACSESNAELCDYTAAPWHGTSGNGGHEWLVEFHREPQSMDGFIQTLDRALRELNSDYDSKRTDGLILALPRVHVAPKGLFERWMREKGKLGGQNKVPRLWNDRTHLESLLELRNRIQE